MKTNIIFLFSIVSSLVIASHSVARLGDSTAVSAKRYGPPVREGLVHMNPLHKDALEKRYHHDGWRLRVAYAEDLTIIVAYMKIARMNSPEGLLADDEINAILKAESQGHSWQKVPRGTKLTKSKKYQKYFNSAIRLWINPNGSVAWTSTNYAISLISGEGLAFDINQVKKKEENRKKNVPKF